MIVTFWAACAFALQVDLTPEELEAHAELVVTGEVTTLLPRWAPGPSGGVETRVVVAVDEVHAGPAVSEVEIHLDGGRLGAFRTTSSEEPELQLDARYRLRLVRDEQGRFRILGGERGATLLAAPQPELGALRYNVSGVSWAHEELPVEDGFTINAESFASRFDPMAVRAAWSLALDIWNLEAQANLYLSDEGTTDNLTYGGGDNGLNVTMMHNQTWGSGLAVAATNAVGGNLTDCDIRIYSRNLYGQIDWSLDPAGAAPNRFDMAHTMIHELGHCLGLGHSGVTDAIMYAYNTSGTGWERRHLHDDDKAGIQVLYGSSAVALSLDVLLADDGDGDGLGASGETWSAEVTLTNDTGAPAVDVMVWVGSTHAAVIAEEVASIGDVPPHTSADVALPLTIEGGCDDGADVPLEVIAEDAAGNRWSASVDLALACGDAPDPVDAPADEDDGGEDLDARAGCGCATTTTGGGLLLPVLLLLARRRRGQASAGQLSATASPASSRP